MNRVIICMLFLTAGQVSAQTGAGGGVLAYTRQPLAGGVHQIRVINVDGTGDRVLVDAAIGLNHHEWSREARRIATVGYVAPDNSTWSIHVVDVEGGNLQRLTTVNNVWDSEPTWSPDGQRIAYCRIYPDQGYRSEMWVMNADGGDQHWIGELGFAPRWSPDGTRFVYQSSLFGASDIHTCAVDGSDVQVLFASPLNEGNPDWSPDGTQIVLTIYEDSDLSSREIWVMSAAGTGAVQLTDNAVLDDLARWSPDGTMLAFHSDLPGHAEIYVMNADGSDRRRVTSMPADVTAINASWCPLLQGPYLGQATPAGVLERFPPFPYIANAEWFWHGAPTFSPDGLEMYYTAYDRGLNGTGIFVTKIENGVWAWPRRAAFSSESFRDNCPVFSESGDTLYFNSSRPGGNIFRVERSGDSWSVPAPLGLSLPIGTNLGLQFSVARNGDVYGELWVDGDNDLDLFRWQLSDGGYDDAEDLGPAVNSADFDFMPFVDPQQRFLIFASMRSGGLGANDIWLCERAGDGDWSNAVNAGSEVNSGQDEVWPYLSPDGSNFFVTSGQASDQGFNPYWIDAAAVLDIITPVSTRNWGSLKTQYR